MPADIEAVTASVLVVARDVEAHDALAAGLRAEGLDVAFATSAEGACERVRAASFDAVVSDPTLEGPEGTALVDLLAFELGSAPPVLPLTDDLATLAERVRALADVRDRGVRSSVSPRSMPVSSLSVGPSSSTVLPHLELRAGKMAEILGALATEGRTAMVEVATQDTLGFVAVVDGEIVDCVLGSATGEKALARALAATQGTARVGALEGEVARALEVPTRKLLLEAAQRGQAFDRLVRDRGTLEGLLHVRDGAASGDDATTAQVAERLRFPRELAALLDDVPAPDDAVLAAALSLAAKGRLARVDGGDRAGLASTSDPFEVRALVARGRRPGYGDVARLVVAGSTARLAVLAHTALGLSDVVPSEEPAPPVPLPSVAARVRFGDGIDLDLVALPLVPAYAPLWPQALLGSFLVVRVDDLGGATLDEACAAARVPRVDVRALVTGLDEASPASVAELLRAAIAHRDA